MHPRRRLGDRHSHIHTRQGRGRRSWGWMPVRSGSSSGGQREGNGEPQQTGTPQPPPHRPLPRRGSPHAGEIADDPAALSDLLSTLQPRLLGSLLSRRGVDREMARDACQDTFAVFLDKRPAVESVEHAFAWLNITAHRQVTKWQSHRRRVTPAEVPDQVVPDVAESVETSLFLAATAEAFAELRPKDRKSLRLAVEGQERGESRRERNRVALVVHRARKRLRSKLDDWWALLLPWRRTAGELPAALPPVLGVKVVAALMVGGAVLLPARPQQRDTTERLTAAATTAATPRASFEDRRPTPVARGASPPPAHGDRAPTTPPGGATPPPPTPRPGPLDNHRVEVDSPATHGPIEVGTSPRRPEDRSLACWGNLIVVADGCIPHPLYEQP